jgi:hypothetical protein
MADVHIIQRLRFEVDFGAEDQAFEQQSRLSAFAQGPALRVIADVLDQHSRPDQVWQIAALQVDLGVVDGTEMESQWESRLRDRLALALQDQQAALSASAAAVARTGPARGPNPPGTVRWPTGAAGRPGSSPQAPMPGSNTAARDAAIDRVAPTPFSTRAASQVDVLLHFLRCGHWPWQVGLGEDAGTAAGTGAATATGSGFDRLAEAVLRDSPSALVDAWRRSSPAQSAAMLERSVRQFSGAWLADFAQAAGASSSIQARAWIDGVAGLLGCGGLAAAEIDRARLWQGLLDALLAGRPFTDRDALVCALVGAVASDRDIARRWQALAAACQTGASGALASPVAIDADVFQACRSTSARRLAATATPNRGANVSMAAAPDPIEAANLAHKPAYKPPRHPVSTPTGTPTGSPAENPTPVIDSGPPLPGRTDPADATASHAAELPQRLARWLADADRTGLDPQPDQAGPNPADAIATQGDDPWPALLSADPGAARLALAGLGRSAWARRQIAETVPESTLSAIAALVLPAAQQGLLFAALDFTALWGIPPLPRSQRWELALAPLLLGGMPPGAAPLDFSTCLDSVLRQRSDRSGETPQQLIAAIAAALGDGQTKPPQRHGNFDLALRALLRSQVPAPAAPPQFADRRPTPTGAGAADDNVEVGAQRPKATTGIDDTPVAPHSRLQAWIADDRSEGDAVWAELLGADPISARATLAELDRSAKAPLRMASALPDSTLRQLAAIVLDRPAHRLFFAAFDSAALWGRPSPAPVQRWELALTPLLRHAAQPDSAEFKVGDLLDSIRRQRMAQGVESPQRLTVAAIDDGPVERRDQARVGVEAPAAPTTRPIALRRQQIQAELAQGRCRGVEAAWSEAVADDAVWLRAEISQLGLSARWRRQIARSCSEAELSLLLALHLSPTDRILFRQAIARCARLVGGAAAAFVAIEGVQASDTHRLREHSLAYLFLLPAGAGFAPLDHVCFLLERCADDHERALADSVWLATSPRGEASAGDQARPKKGPATAASRQSPDDAASPSAASAPDDRAEAPASRPRPARSTARSGGHAAPVQSALPQPAGVTVGADPAPRWIAAFTEDSTRVIPVDDQAGPIGPFLARPDERARLIAAMAEALIQTLAHDILADSVPEAAAARAVNVDRAGRQRGGESMAPEPTAGDALAAGRSSPATAAGAWRDVQQRATAAGRRDADPVRPGRADTKQGGPSHRQAATVASAIEPESEAEIARQNDRRVEAEVARALAARESRRSLLNAALARASLAGVEAIWDQALDLDPGWLHDTAAALVGVEAQRLRVAQRLTGADLARLIDDLKPRTDLVTALIAARHQAPAANGADAGTGDSQAALSAAIGLLAAGLQSPSPSAFADACRGLLTAQADPALPWRAAVTAAWEESPEAFSIALARLPSDLLVQLAERWMPAASYRRFSDAIGRPSDQDGDGRVSQRGWAAALTASLRDDAAADAGYRTDPVDRIDRGPPAGDDAGAAQGDHGAANNAGAAVLSRGFRQGDTHLVTDAVVAARSDGAKPARSGSKPGPSAMAVAIAADRRGQTSPDRAELLRLLTAKPDAAARAACADALAAALQDPTPQQRQNWLATLEAPLLAQTLVERLSPTRLGRLLHWLRANDAAAAIRCAALIASAWRRLGAPSAGADSPERLLWRFVLRELFEEGRSFEATGFAQRAAQVLVDTLPAGEAHRALAALAGEVASETGTILVGSDALSDAAAPSTARPASIAPPDLSAAAALDDESASLSTAADSSSRPASPVAASAAPAAISAATAPDWRRAEIDTVATRPLPQRPADTMAAVVAQALANAAASVSPSTPTSTPTEVADFSPPPDAPGDAIYIANAGMVLAGVYIERLFAMLGLVKDSAFVDDAAAERGVHLLQHLVTGARSSPEPALVLNKILCGLPIATPVRREIELSATEAATIEGLLKALIAHWKIIGSTSVAGLRESFLCREGRLSRDDEAWHLRVEARAFDMLLDQLPWGYSPIKFAWMKVPLHVDWR